MFDQHLLKPSLILSSDACNHRHRMSCTARIIRQFTGKVSKRRTTSTYKQPDLRKADVRNVQDVNKFGVYFFLIFNLDTAKRCCQLPV